MKVMSEGILGPICPYNPYPSLFIPKRILGPMCPYNPSLFYTAFRTIQSHFSPPPIGSEAEAIHGIDGHNRIEISVWGWK